MSGHKLYMQRCLDLAVLGMGKVSPNPMVGAVIVHINQIIYWYMMHDTGTGTGDMDTWYIYGYMTPVLVLPVQDTWTHGKRYRYMILVHMHTVVRGASLFNCAWTPAPTTHRPMH